MLAAVITKLKDIQKAEGADLIELRLDYIKNLNNKKLKSMIKHSKKPVIATCRKNGEGGFFNGSEAKRIEILKNAANIGADCVDIECSSDKKSIKSIIKNKKNAHIIVSYHNCKETPINIKNIYNNIKKLNPDLIKIVTNANSVTDNFGIFDLIKTANNEKRKIIAFCMGSYGEFSRILGIIFGSRITYASVKEGKESAPGQLTIDELNNIYRIKKINKNTKITGLIGNPVEHSWSHIMHNAAFDKLDINAVYFKFKVDKLKEFIDYFRGLNTLGFSVTIPHKIEVMEFLDRIDNKAKEIGAVNTIVAEHGKLAGYNTDCDGAVKALNQKARLKNKNVVVLGAGGSSRALAYGLMENNANVTVLNRTIKKAKSIADDFGCSYGSLKNLKKADYDILVNTTSVGMYPNANSSPIPAALIKKNSIVFDIVFNPYKTKLLRDAEKRGCAVIPGIEMLVNGNAMQFSLWTGKKMPEQLAKNKVMNYLKNASHQN